MRNMIEKVELLAPAGNMEKLIMALEYGADAVYIGGKKFGLRARADNFSVTEIGDAIKYTHKKNKKIYIVLNAIMHNESINALPEYIERISQFKPDAFIVSDPGLIQIIKEKASDIDIHLSTQENTTNWKSAEFWHSIGVKRIIIAREVSLEEIKEISDKTVDTLELEAFVHGAMCISYSGRCLLSIYMTGRSSNLGDCAQPCRWKYYLTEEKRENEYYPVTEDENGTFIFNSKDLCMVEHIPELIESGLKSLKIEGRMKSAYYVATIVRAYRTALDAFYQFKSDYQFDNNLIDEVRKISNRDYTKGFFLKKAENESQNYGSASYKRSCDFIGIVQSYNVEEKMLVIQQRNKFVQGELIEFLTPKGEVIQYSIDEIFDHNNEEIEAAPHPKMTVKLKFGRELPRYTIVRRNKIK